jgi:hypothetical protein
VLTATLCNVSMLDKTPAEIASPGLFPLALRGRRRCPQARRPRHSMLPCANYTTCSIALPLQPDKERTLAPDQRSVADGRDGPGGPTSGPAAPHGPDTRQWRRGGARSARRLPRRGRPTVGHRPCHRHNKPGGWGECLEPLGPRCSTPPRPLIPSETPGPCQWDTAGGRVSGAHHAALATLPSGPARRDGGSYRLKGSRRTGRSPDLLPGRPAGRAIARRAPRNGWSGPAALLPADAPRRRR